MSLVQFCATQVCQETNNQLCYAFCSRQRPTASELESKRLPEMMARYPCDERPHLTPGSRSSGERKQAEGTRSVLYLYNTSLMSISLVDGLPSKIKIRQVHCTRMEFVKICFLRFFSNQFCSRSWIVFIFEFVGCFATCVKILCPQRLLHKIIFSKYLCSSSATQIFTVKMGLLLIF